MSDTRLEYGDRVRVPTRPEWGLGQVVRVETGSAAGRPAQRVSVRFPNVGLKIFNTSKAELERVSGEGPTEIPHDRPSAADWQEVDQAGWLGPVAERKISQIMTSLAPEAKDPFASLRARLRYTVGLYRFQRTGGPLIDWAVAQSGLDDPLSRFTRHELELWFDRWADARDAHLARLLQEARKEPELVRELLADAAPSAREAISRLQPVR